MWVFRELKYSKYIFKFLKSKEWNLDYLAGWFISARFATMTSLTDTSANFNPFQCGDRLYTSESDVCRRQPLM